MKGLSLKTAGRKRSFDKDEALDKAMRVFWDNGFAGTSLTDLTGALGINKPSLYAAFGNKEQLFQAAMEHSIDKYGSPLFELLTQSTDKAFSQRLQNYLFAVVELNCSDDAPKGCFLVKSCCESGGAGMPDDISSLMLDTSYDFEAALCNILQSEKHRGQLPTDLNAKDTAAYILSIIYGLSIMARRGKSCRELKSIVKAAIKMMDLQ
jgi:AcrR family transcriptional regulator